MLRRRNEKSMHFRSPSKAKITGAYRKYALPVGAMTGIGIVHTTGVVYRDWQAHEHFRVWFYLLELIVMILPMHLVCLASVFLSKTK